MSDTAKGMNSYRYTIGRSGQGAKTAVKVNNIPSCITTETLHSRFSQYGVCNVEFHNRHLGYALVSYISKSEARKAVRQTNGTILNGNVLTVYVKGDNSADNHTVKVTSLPKQVTEDELEKLFSLGDKADLVSIKLNNTSDSPFNYAYVNYGSYQDAQQAESNLDGINVYGSKIKVKVHGKMPSTQNIHYQSTPQVPGYQRQPLKPLPFVPFQSYSPVSQPTPTSTLKVSIHGSLSAEDLEQVFSNYGALRDKPIIRQGTPIYAYVNFVEAHNASIACHQLNNREVKGVRISVRLQQQGHKQPSLMAPPKANTEQHSSGSHECRPVACRCIVARLLTMPSSKFADDLQKVCQTQQVIVKARKGDNGVNLLGDKDKLSAAEVCIQLIIDKIEAELGKKTLKLPCHHIPQFSGTDILKLISEVEEKHCVEVLVLDKQGQGEEDPRLFINFAATQLSNKSGTAITVSSFSKYLSSSTVTSSPSVTTTASTATSDDLWLWQDDNGSFTPYTPDLCKKINDHFKVSPTTTLMCTIPTKLGSAVYSINFGKMVQTNLQTSNTRSIIRETPGALQWLYRDDTKVMVPYSSQDSAKIEAMTKSSLPSILTINGRRYTFDFTNMVQINVSTKHKRKIERRATASPSRLNDDLYIQLSVHGLSDNLSQAISDLNTGLQKGVSKKTIPLPPSSDEAFRTSLLQTTCQYLVSTKIANGKLKFVGVQSFIHSVEVIVMKEFYAHEKKILSQAVATQQGTEFPENWEIQTEKIALKLVQNGSTEWNKVAGRVEETLPNVVITKIERIQNKWLWEKYSFSKQRMMKKNKGVVNEKLLFHGTRDTAPEKIFKSEQGFDFRFASTGLWGTGTYFAVNASYSERYAHNSGASKQLILANVLTGETYPSVQDNTLKKPPVKHRYGSGARLRNLSFGSSSTTDDFEDELYDSVTGHAQGSDIFIIYDHEKAYPAYLITFY